VPSFLFWVFKNYL